MKEKIAAFASLLEAEQLRGLIAWHTDCEANRENRKVKIVPGPKYTKVDIGSSGRYMVVNTTGEIFGIKAYGVIHRGHYFGTLDTITSWDWSGYWAAARKAVAV